MKASEAAHQMKALRKAWVQLSQVQCMGTRRMLMYKKYEANRKLKKPCKQKESDGCHPSCNQ
jgi:hypothetical protein